MYLLLLSDAVYVRKAYELIRASAPAASDGRSLSELRVLCAEQSLQGAVINHTAHSDILIRQSFYFLLHFKQSCAVF